MICIIVAFIQRISITAQCALHIITLIDHMTIIDHFQHPGKHARELPVSLLPGQPAGRPAILIPACCALHDRNRISELFMITYILVSENVEFTVSKVCHSKLSMELLCNSSEILPPGVPEQFKCANLHIFHDNSGR